MTDTINPDTSDLTCPDDYKALVYAIFSQALGDYVKLMHPSYRREKYLLEDFLSAVAMFFDPTYEFAHIKNEDGHPMKLDSMVGVLLDGNQRKYKNVQSYLINEAKEFWETKSMKVIDIPSTIQINGHVYFIEHTDDIAIDSDDGYKIEYPDKVVYLDRKTQDSVNQELFTMALVELLFYHEEIKATRQNIRVLGRGLFRLLKLNDCFNGSGYVIEPKATTVQEDALSEAMVVEL